MGIGLKFIVRLILSIIISSVIGVFFFEGNPLIKTACLAGGMLVFAYLFEFTRKREK